MKNSSYLYWHWNVITSFDLATIPGGVWVRLWDGRTELADRHCVRSLPFGDEGPCDTCGWKGEVIQCCI